MKNVARPDEPREASRHPAGTRRFVTLLFADLCDSSRLAADVDAEVFAEVLRSLREIARDVVHMHGGTIARIQSDGLLAMFGYPEHAEDDARRAAEAAIDLRDAVNALHVPGVPAKDGRLGVHAGI